MPDESGHEPTFVGYVASVVGGLIRVRLRDTPTTLVMVGGESYRVGQIGGFLRIPLGYTSLYGICTQVGADAAPPQQQDDVLPTLEVGDRPSVVGYRWMTIALFGEAVGGQFDRGVGQYPTVGDEVHLVTARDLDVIYRDRDTHDAIEIGRITGSTAIPARLQLSSLISRHSCVVGSTGSGKSNLVAVVLECLSGGDFRTARLLIVDPHGEYGSAVGDKGRVIRTGADIKPGARRLRVPYWALPFDELLDMTMGDMQPHIVEALRDRVRDLKVEAAAHLADPPPVEAITADSPLPFSIRRLWFELEDEERATYKESNKQDCPASRNLAVGLVSGCS